MKRKRAKEQNKFLLERLPLPSDILAKARVIAASFSENEGKQSSQDEPLVEQGTDIDQQGVAAAVCDAADSALELCSQLELGMKGVAPNIRAMALLFRLVEEVRGGFSQCAHRDEELLHFVLQAVEQVSGRRDSEILHGALQLLQQCLEEEHDSMHHMDAFAESDFFQEGAGPHEWLAQAGGEQEESRRLLVARLDATNEALWDMMEDDPFAEGAISTLGADEEGGTAGEGGGRGRSLRSSLWDFAVRVAADPLQAEQCSALHSQACVAAFCPVPSWWTPSTGPPALRQLLQLLREEQREEGKEQEGERGEGGHARTLLAGLRSAAAQSGFGFLDICRKAPQGLPVGELPVLKLSAEDVFVVGSQEEGDDDEEEDIDDEDQEEREGNAPEAAEEGGMASVDSQQSFPTPLGAPFWVRTTEGVLAAQLFMMSEGGGKGGLLEGCLVVFFSQRCDQVLGIGTLQVCDAGCAGFTGEEEGGEDGSDAPSSGCDSDSNDDECPLLVPAAPSMHGKVDRHAMAM